MTTEEKSIYEAADIKVTNLRAVFGAKTYAVSNISAVETETKPPPQFIPAVMAMIGGIMLLIFVSSLFGNNTYNAALNRSVNWNNLIFGAIFLAAGLGILRVSKPTYIVKISTASGEVRAYESGDKESIEKIVESLNTAIIQKG